VLLLLLLAAAAAAAAPAPAARSVLSCGTYSTSTVPQSILAGLLIFRSACLCACRAASERWKPTPIVSLRSLGQSVAVLMTGRADRTSEETNKKEKEKEEEADSIRRLKSASSQARSSLLLVMLTGALQCY
jgi:hypothetical protein